MVQNKLFRANRKSSVSVSIRERYENGALTISTLLAVSLAFFVPLTTVKNIDARAYLLLLAGIFAWVYVFLKRDIYNIPKLFRPLTLAVLLIVLLSAVLGPHVGYSVFGAPYIRLGVLEFIACVGCAIAFLAYTPRNIIFYLYFGISALMLLSIPYYSLTFHSLWRFGGVFAQADILAVFLGCGFLLGFYIYNQSQRLKPLIFITELGFMILLVLTQTRAVLLITALLSLILVWQYYSKPSAKFIVACAVSGIGILVVMFVVQPARLASPQYAAASISYRLELQQNAITASTKRIPLGYGIGNLADAYDCSKLKGSALQKTCQEGYFFNSSHNVFLDRFVGFGWFVGLAYVGFVAVSIYRGFKGSRELRIVAACALLIALYYYTNVTNAVLELLLWVLLVACWRTKLLKAAG